MGDVRLEDFCLATAVQLLDDPGGVPENPGDLQRGTVRGGRPPLRCDSPDSGLPERRNNRLSSIRRSERFPDEVAPEEVPKPGFEKHTAMHGPSSDQIDLLAQVGAVAWVDAKSLPTANGGPRCVPGTPATLYQ